MSNSDKKKPTQTGPKSLAGKANARINSMKHGLRAKKLLTSFEDPKEYEAHAERIFQALDPQDCIEEMRVLDKERREVLVKGLHAAGWDVPSPEASMFLWAPIPERFRHLGSVGFSKLLLEKAKVAVAPGLGFGEHGDEHVRIALVENSHRIRQALRGIKTFLGGDNAAPQDSSVDMVNA
jgi:aspartate/methionine/tyrosine aminotransferase